MIPRPARLLLAFLALISACDAGSDGGAEARLDVAVAANFAACAEILSRRFEEIAGCEVVLTSGSTGRLAKQIEEGAPFAVFLAADVERPERLVARGRAEAESRFTYARGRLVLAVPRGRPAPTGLDDLRAARAARIAIARAELAPYGRAAEEVLKGLDLDNEIVVGENVAQVLHFVVSGAADYGFVPASLAVTGGLPHLELPAGLHAAIEQQAVLIDARSALARRFMAFLRSPAALDEIRRCGYEPGG